MHGADAQITEGGRPLIPADVAADGISRTAARQPARSTTGRATCTRTEGAPGDSLHVHAADVPDGTGEWLVSHDPAGVTVRRAHQKATLALRGGASDLLLLLLRRLPPMTRRSRCTASGGAGPLAGGDPVLARAGSPRHRVPPADDSRSGNP